MSKRVLILCTGNSCRSQMAEGFWRRYGGQEWQAFSAGVRPIGLNPRAVQVMREIGIDISGQTSKSVGAFVDLPFDLVVTVCSSADRNCPTFHRAAHREHWPIDDPAAAHGSDEQVMARFRRVRDEIGQGVRRFLTDKGT